MRTLTWQDFERAVDAIVERCQGQRFCGVHGIPRGGLVLAVTLSHRLDLPLLSSVQPGCLLVDDVYETGLTLEPYRELEHCTPVVWLSKVEPQWWQAVEVTESNEWIVFPWESAAAAALDEQLYRASR
ncbi:MAG: phosphoribosyltransferase [Vulcanococcus sp.]|jgi:hypoxanthine phosphoribosyltransferase|uniref:phosphoribosyltransferase n=1 Tax=Vulcanococcus sp. TaxID=2856995 RepID=UPI0025FC69C9|nr:phosphoribosyltransferase [Vulcanococcus sp.]MBW0172830.1 phosphoribosyltransferase [Vulcanococcus sp.]MBW0181510.1 phosphoribosyltransferase [Vulcanococcus sp.]